MFVRPSLHLALLALLAPLPLGAQGPGGPCPLPVPMPSGPSPADAGVPEPAWDLRCIELLPAAAGGDARGVVTLHRPPSSFGVSVTPGGRHVWRLSARVENLPDPASLGPYSTYVAWAAPLTLDPVIRLGEVGGGTAEAVDLGTVDFSKFLVMISAEASADVEEREGPLVLRGRSPSSRMDPHDMMALAPAAEEPRREPVDRGGNDSDRDGDLDDGEEAAWDDPPGYPGVPMLRGMTAVEPGQPPLALEPPEGVDPPAVRDREVVTLPDGGTLDLTAGLVRRRVAGREAVMLAFNGQHPGPLIRVAQNTTIFVNFRNETPLPTAVHWHGIRLDNRFDGVPGVTQEPVAPGESFRYRIRFPDAGIYWYHPHHREDVQQELGLSGNLLVEPRDADAYGPVNHEEVLLLDDLLLDEDGPVAFGSEAATHALMGRFGNVMLVNGQPEYGLEVRRGEVVRFHLTNAASTRTFNLSFRRVGSPEALPLKVVATDVSRFEREVMARSVVLAPAERYVVDVLFEEPGTYRMVNHVQGINHREGVFVDESSELGTVDVVDADGPPTEDLREAFRTLRTHEDVVADIDAYRDRFDDSVDWELVLALEADSLPLPVEQAMRFDWIYRHPVEWTGTMPRMNWALSAHNLRWVIREPDTGRENMQIDWDLEVGDVIKLRIHNDRSSVHSMHHPMHIHGQRFLVLEQDGVENPHLAWKDTALLPPGSTTDILLEVSNPGRWMMHCHIAEHREAGMQFVFDVEGS